MSSEEKREIPLDEIKDELNRLKALGEAISIMAYSPHKITPDSLSIMGEMITELSIKAYEKLEGWRP